MKKLMSTNYSAGAFNAAMLLFRLALGILMMNHGYMKLIGFASMKDHFMSFLGLGPSLSLALDIFAEFFCSLFLILGLFTRLATIPLIIVMSVAITMVHNYDFFGKGELATHYLACYLVLLILGPGRVSVDSMTGK